MNARLYDPSIGRFVSPDPYVQAPDFSQNFNRYSYCLNNPLKYTDPSGKFIGIDDLFAFLVGGTINLGINLLQGNIHNFGQGCAYFLVGGVAGEASLYAGPLGGAAVLGIGNSMSNQYITNGSIDLNQTLMDATISIGVSAVGGMFGYWLGPHLNSVVAHLGISSPVINQMLSQSVENAVSGSIIGGALALGSGDSFGEIKSEMLKGAATGAAIGAISGFATGLQYARQNKISPWTGEKTNKHHSYPKSLGGDVNQPLTTMSASRHRELHSDMNDFLKNNPSGNMMPRRGHNGEAIQRHFGIPNLFQRTRSFYDSHPYKYWDARYDFYKNNHLFWLPW